MSKKNLDVTDYLANVVKVDGRTYYKNADGTLELLDENVNKKLSTELQWKIAEHGRICEFIKDLYKTKNADYGDSMHPLFQEYGLTAFLVLFGTKIQRIKTLMTKDSKATYESLEDSLLDLANYALIAVTELRAEKLNGVQVVSGNIEDVKKQLKENHDFGKCCFKKDIDD